MHHKHLFVAALAIVASLAPALAQNSQVQLPSTSYSRNVLRARDAAEARTLLGIVNAPVINPISTNTPSGVTNVVSGIAATVVGSSLTASNTGLPESFYLAAGAVPPMGWHSWNTQNQTNLWATNILAAIDGLYTNGLVPYGWNWVEIDDNVFTSTNAAGLLIPDATRWPNGIKSVVDYAHARGIKVMLYSELGLWTDGIKQEKNPDGSWVWPSYGTQGRHVENGHQFASWGIDGVWTHGDWGTTSTAEESYKRMIEYYRAVSTNRPIYFISINSKPQAWEDGGDLLRPENSQNWSCWYPGSGISQDIASDLLPGMEMLIDVTAQPSASRTIRPGHHVFFGVYPLVPSWIRMGFGGVAMFPGPLMITTWPSEWKTLPLATQQVMTNSDYIAILQDKDVVPAVKVLDMPTLSYDWIKAGYIPVNPNATNVLSPVTNSVWYRPLSTPGSFAVFLLNRGSNTANIYFSRTNFPVAPTTYKMLDVWSRTAMPDLTNQTVTVAVPSNSISIYRMSLPPMTTTVSDADISIPFILENPVADTGGGNAWVIQITNSANATGMKMGQVLGELGFHGIQLWNGPNLGYDTCSIIGTTNQTGLGVPNSSGLFTWRAGTTIIASMKGNGATYLNSLSVSNGYCLSQLSEIPTNSIPATSTTASATNWFLVNVGGIPQFIATNKVNGGWLKKPLWP